MTRRQKLELLDRLIEIVKNRRGAQFGTKRLIFFQLERNDATDLQIILEQLRDEILVDAI